MHGGSEGRALAAALAIALCLSVLVAWPAAANFGGVFPTDEDGGTAIEVINADQNLFAFTLTDIQGGDVCIVDAAMANPGDGSLNCLTPAWGSSNRVMGIGSRWTFIEAPYLEAGHWKLLGDGGSVQSVDVFSNEFTVLPCQPGACDPRLALLTAQRYKNAAAEMAATMRGIGWTLKVLEEVSPQEPFEHVNVINAALKSKLADDVLYKRVIADKATRKLQYATRIPAGPHAMALAIAHQVSADALEMYLDIVNDPPAPYDTVAPPEFDVPEASAEDPQLDGLMLDVAQLAGYGAAGRKAFERYQLADTDDSEAGVHRQAAAMGENVGQMTAEMWAAAAGLDMWADRLAADPVWAGATVGQEQVDELKAIAERVRTSGFTADERAVFAADLSDATIDGLEDTLGEDGYDAVRVGVSVEQVLRDAAADLREQAPEFDAVAREAKAVAQSTDTAPVASFDATPESGAPPLQVAFRDTSVHPDDEPLTITWDFGDGSPTAEGPEVTHTFNAGTFVVTQTVTDGVSTSTATRTIVATPPNGAPTARITRTPAEGTVPLSVSFDGAESSDDGAIMSYEWAFGDGASSQGPAVTHVYETPGTYTATLTVTDDGGKTGTATTTVVVREPPPDQPPVAGADELTTRENTAKTIDVLANDSDPEGGALKVVSTGTPSHGTASCAEQGECTYTPAAGYAGPDAFSYVVEDPAGGRTTGHVTVTVNDVNDPPVADAGPDRNVQEGESLVLSATGSEDDGSIVEYTWDFGDGSEPVTGVDAWHIYGRPGTYTVRLVVTDDEGATGEDTVTVQVANVPPTVSAAAFPRASVGVTRPYWATVSTGTHDPTEVEVDFGDGSASAKREMTGFTTPSFDHAYAQAGVYHVTFTATDSAGETATAESTVRVEDPIAAAGDDVSADEGDSVELGGASTPPDGHTSVTWDFGDGSPPASGVEQDHVYRDEGVYTATVTVEDDAKKASDSVKVTVANAVPDPGLSIAGGAEPGKPVSMRGFAADPGADDDHAITWKFGDGATGSGARVKHAYAAAGTYTVEVRADDGDGGVATEQAEVVVGGPKGRRDNRGRDFWLSFPTNYSETPALTLFIASETATTGSVEVPGIGWSERYSVTPGEVTAVKLPARAQLDRSVKDMQDLGIHVAAKADIAVYGLNRIKFTTDAFVGLPTDAVGTDYRVISYEGFGGSEASVVATADDTTVTITSTAGITGYPAGEPIEVELDMGEAHQLRTEGDLTGTRIVADKPVAAFGGHQCANVPVSAAFCDHLVEQLTPVDTWGRAFATMPLATRTGGDTFRIVASEAGTTVKVNGTTVATLDAGGFHERLIDGPAAIEASKPVLVAQYSNGSTFDKTASDPFMTIVPPSEQFQPSYTVSTPAEGFAKNVLNLVVPEQAKAGVFLDGQPVPAASFKAIGTSGFAGAQIEVGLGSHRVSSGSPLGVTVYGYDQDDSYGYGGGFALAEIASVTQLALTPASETLAPGSDGCVEARGTDAAGAPVPDVRVDFTVTGEHAGSGFASTGANGVARHCWRGTKLGDDTVTAAVGALTRTAVKRWRNPPPPEGPLDPGLVVDPAPPVKEESKQEVKGESSASDLVLGCTERLVVLEDVVPAGPKVRLVGVADRRFAGRTVSIVFVPTGKVVAKPKVAPDGSFAASAPLPPKRVRNSNATRYEARIGKERSLKLKLARRMRITSIGVSGGKVVVTGTVVGPFAVKKTDRMVELQRSVSCTRTESVAKAMPRANGTFRFAVDVPPGQSAAVYRLRTKVRQGAGSPRAVNTFTLPRGVNF